jgi:putative ABC transport system ATP-binding protein
MTGSTNPAPPPIFGPMPAPASPAIDLSNVSLTLPSRAGPVEILRGVDLRVREGEALGLVGPSGSGKTTLLMVIAGLEQVSGGDVIVAGERITGRSEDQLASFRRDRVGIVFQSFHLIPTMTALENVAVPLEFRGLPDALDIARSKLESVGLGHRLTHYPGQLSGGEQQRTAIARALASGARIILADEPTGNLDHDTGEEIIRLLFDLRMRHETSLVLVTHDQDLAARCDRIAEMRDGRIVAGTRP